MTRSASFILLCSYLFHLACDEPTGHGANVVAEHIGYGVGPVLPSGPQGNPVNELHSLLCVLDEFEPPMGEEPVQ